jgi:photoactive yellow protein
MSSAPQQVEEQIWSLSQNDLDTFPDGVITLDRNAKILRYNKTEASLARRDGAETIGRNFFRDVAPCAAVQEFQGRFEAFAKHADSGVERFDFTFLFAWGQQDVSIMMIRKAGIDEINLIISRRSKKN